MCNVLYDMVCLINSYAIINPYYQYIEEIYFGAFLESIFKEGIKLLIQSFKADPVLFSCNYVFCLYSINIIKCLLGPREDIMLRVNPYHLYCV